MFQNKKDEVSGFESNWKVQKSSDDGTTQTSDIATGEIGVQASSSQDMGVQTENTLNGVAAKLETEVEDRLATFLRRIEPLVLKELDKAAKSHDQLRAVEMAPNEEHLEPASCLHTLHASTHSNTQVSSLSWSPSGAVIAAGHSWPRHEGWCSHDSEIHFYNINMPDFDSTQPSKILSSPSCITILKFHPCAPSLLAAGTYSGELLVWGSDSESAVRAGPSEGHGEAVSAVVWLNPSRSSSSEQSQVLLTAGLDGRLLAWRLETEKGPLSLQHSFGIGCEHLPEKLRSASCDDLQPVTSLALIGRGDRPSCLVGTQAGCLLLCDLRDPNREDPVVFSYKGHQGSVSSISVHPTTPQLFASCGEDREIHIYCVKQENALKIVQCSRACTGVSWSLRGSLAWWGGGSEAEVLNVGGDDFATTQLATLEPDLGLGNPGHSTALSFNAALPRLVAVGDADARLRIWKVPLPNTTR